MKYILVIILIIIGVYLFWCIGRKGGYPDIPEEEDSDINRKELLDSIESARKSMRDGTLYYSFEDVFGDINKDVQDE